MTKKYVTPSEAAEYYGVHVGTLRRWENEGKIKAYKTPGGQRRYILPDDDESEVIILYARVSTHSQKEDLQRQVEFLQSKYPNGTVVSEVGSGLNFRRRKFIKVLEQVNAGTIKKLVVAYPDRLVRFGFELVSWLCEQHGVELLVLNDRKLSPEAELVQDMLSIIHCFSARLYGLRKYTKEVKEVLQKEPQTQEVSQEETKQCLENTGVSI